MGRRRYGQYCAVAKALDVVGERWTLLLIRELLIGPKRYTDLLDGLPGIGTNLLSERLKQLETHGVIRKRHLPPPADCDVYQLTDFGRGLEPVILALGQWGLSQLGQPGADEDFRPSWVVLATRITFRPEEAWDLQETYELRIDDQVFRLHVDDGSLETAQGHADAPDLVLITDTPTFLALASRQLDVDGAIENGNITIQGEREALARFDRIFGLPDKASD